MKAWFLVWGYPKDLIEAGMKKKSNFRQEIGILRETNH